MEEEINLRKYIDVLFRQWKVIVSITLMAVIVSALISFLSPSIYEAKAAVLITTAKSEIILVPLAPEYRTYPEQDTPSLRQTLFTLVKSNTVATQVIEKLGDKLNPEEQRPGYILDRVEAAEQGNLFQVSVKFPDPYKAAAIAGAWVEAYESYINSLYTGLAQSPEKLQVQADAAKEEYEQKQKVLEDFISDNRIDELSQQMADKELLCKIKYLREQIKAGSSSSASDVANSLALILLQTRAFASLPIDQVSLDISSGVLKTSLDDIDTLISTLELRLGGTRGQSIVELQQEIKQLKAELVREQAKQWELEQSRDIAWRLYTIVAGKVMEVRAGIGAESALVQVADVAVVPGSPVAPRRGMNISIALVLGLIAGIFCAFGVEYFRKAETKGQK